MLHRVLFALDRAMVRHPGITHHRCRIAKRVLPPGSMRAEGDARLMLQVPIVYPRVHRRFGHTVIFRAQISMYPLVFGLIPVISLVRWWRYDPTSAQKPDALTLALLGVLLCLELLGQTMFSKWPNGRQSSCFATG